MLGPSFPTSNPTEMISKPLTERRRDAMYQSDCEPCKQEIAPVRMSRDSQLPAAKTPLLEEAEEHGLISQEIDAPSDDPEDRYEFKIIPPSPKDQKTSMSEKQDSPRGQQQPLDSTISGLVEFMELCNLLRDRQSGGQDWCRE